MALKVAALSQAVPVSLHARLREARGYVDRTQSELSEEMQSRLEMAGVRRLGLEPMRRTIITFDAPPGMDVSAWPFAKTVGDELYFAPESGRLFASPMDEVPSDPCDAQPDELEVALAVERVEQRTLIKVERIAHKWAGLRTFAPDRQPVAGFAGDAPGFFWLAGQGGFGLQTSPILAKIAESLIAGAPWPLPQVDPVQFGTSRN